MQIVPNLHPIFVHFTVALLPLAAGFFLLSRLDGGARAGQWRTLAFWMLWLGVGISLLTLGSGIYAYNTVDHDTPSHLAMTEHRNWAFGTMVVYLLVGVWSLLEYRKSAAPGWGLVGASLLACLLLASTAWHGGELVYRYGLGVMSLPESSGEGHDHDHGEGADHHGAVDAGPDNAADHDNSDGHNDAAPAVHDNTDGHHDSLDKPGAMGHDNSDGHHDNSDGHHDKESGGNAPPDNHHDDGHTH